MWHKKPLSITRTNTKERREIEPKIESLILEIDNKNRVYLKLKQIDINLRVVFAYFFFGFGLRFASGGAAWAVVVVAVSFYFLVSQLTPQPKSINRRKFLYYWKKKEVFFLLDKRNGQHIMHQITRLSCAPLQIRSFSFSLHATSNSLLSGMRASYNELLMTVSANVVVSLSYHVTHPLLVNCLFVNWFMLVAAIVAEVFFSSILNAA